MFDLDKNYIEHRATFTGIEIYSNRLRHDTGRRPWQAVPRVQHYSVPVWRWCGRNWEISQEKIWKLTSWITLSANTPNPCLVPWSSLYSEHQPEDLVDISVPMIEAANSAAKQENGSAESCKPQLPSLPLRATKTQQLHRPITQRVTLPWNSRISRGQDKTRSVANSTTRPWIEKDIFRAKTK